MECFNKDAKRRKKDRSCTSANIENILVARSYTYRNISNTYFSDSKQLGKCSYKFNVCTYNREYI